MHKMPTKLLAALALMFTLAASPAAAQVLPGVTWISSGGDDANPCSRTAPCRTFQGALDKTAAGGEIIALDPGYYGGGLGGGGIGGVEITKSITLSGGSGVGIFAPGLVGIYIVAGSADRVVLRGIDIDGVGQRAGIENGHASGLVRQFGIAVISAFDVLIEDCTIHGFLASGVAGDHVTIRNSTIHSNGFGVQVGDAAGTAHVTVVGSLVLDNRRGGLEVSGAGNVIEIADSEVFGPKGLVQEDGGVVRSYGDNVIPSDVTPAETAATK